MLAMVLSSFRRPLCIQFSRQLSYLTNRDNLQTQYDAVIIGAGHNGLVSASYLQKSGMNVCVLERRHLVGGAAVTEEIVPGFKFSRASYVLSLLRPNIMRDMELKKHGFKVYIRNPTSYTPLLEPQGKARSLTLSRSEENNKQQIAQFSQKDAEMFSKYEKHLDHIVSAMEPLLESTPIDLNLWTNEGKLGTKWKNRKPLATLLKSGKRLGKETPAFLEFMTAPASKILDKWFESEPLKATLATDATIGAMTSPYNAESGYILLHHVMGELEGIKGVWGYVEGGMGSVSEAMARCGASLGASIFVNTPVQQITVDSDGKATGVALKDGTEIKARVVLSNATPKVTYLDLLEKGILPEDFFNEVSRIDYSSATTKINVALSRIPDFLADPCEKPNQAGPQHHGTVHLNCENSELIHQAYLEALNGKPSSKPMIEMTLPSALDPTVAPKGAHVAQLFVQFTPYKLAGGEAWDEESKQAFANTVFDSVEQYAPGFKESIVGTDILTPPDLEEVFNLTGGNIFHGSVSLDQLYFSRPTPSYSDHRCPVKHLYLCGSGAHPGGGVMGSAGKLAAETVIQDLKSR